MKMGEKGGGSRVRGISDLSIPELQMPAIVNVWLKETYGHFMVSRF